VAFISIETQNLISTEPASQGRQTMDTLLNASDISFAYGDRPVLREVSLTLAAGEVVALIGPNGSGKSTLLLTLFGHLPVTGALAWNSRPISKWRRRDLARMVAYLPQSPRHDAGQTVRQVLQLGRSPYWGAFGLESSADETLINEVARQLGLTDLLDRPMESMSGGQRQRVFIGRCLAQQPKALLLDEPNTFLDLKYQVELCRLLKQLATAQNLAVLMASHELNVAAAYADRMILLNNGAVAATGKATEVLRPEILAPVYGVNLQRFEGTGGNPIVVPAP
jgi:iron complex transport system ATP-binding protein